MYACRFKSSWKTHVLGHPILLGSADAILVAFDGVHKSVAELGQIKATKLANILCARFPHYHQHVLARNNPKDPHGRHWALVSLFPDLPVFDGLFNFTYPGEEWTPRYGGEIIYLEIINLARNFIHHAADHDRVPIDSS